MRFERGQDPKKSMDIGVASKAVDLQGIYRREERDNINGIADIHYRTINGPDGHAIFRDIQANGIQKDHDKKYWVKPKGSFGYLGIAHMAGKWVEYLKKYYYIPES